jgi:hypothetical protein
LETGSVSVFRWKGGEAPTQLGSLNELFLVSGLALFNEPNSGSVSLPFHVRIEKDPFAKMLCFVRDTG